MTIPNPDHLFEQAVKLSLPSLAGRPRQADLRRAISAAYYGVFHFCLAAAANLFVGVTQRSSTRYAVVYRSIDHKDLRDLCAEAKKQRPSGKYEPYLTSGGFGLDMQAFAAAVIELQGKRHLADYNPGPKFSTSDARLAIETARTAVLRFRAADEEARKTFLTLLICPPR